MWGRTLYMKCAKTLLIFLFSHLPNVRQRSEARGLFLLHILNLPILHLHAGEGLVS